MPLTFPRISAVVITFNESKNIRNCLLALQKVADEIVVVDAMSEDDTVDIAVKMGAKVVQRKWQGYSAAKNYGQEVCANDWILSIDADEVLSDQLIDSIKNLQPENRTVYTLDRCNYFCGQWIKYCGWYPDWKKRIFNRKEVHWEGDFVHETLHIPSSFSIRKLAGKLHHYSYTSPEDHLERIEKYSDLSAQDLFARNKQPSQIKFLFSPYFRFWNTFLFKGGFLDGRNGYLISKHDAYLTKRKYEKLAHLYQQKKFKS